MSPETSGPGHDPGNVKPIASVRRFPSAGVLVIALVALAIAYSFVSGRKPAREDARPAARPPMQVASDVPAADAISAVLKNRRARGLDNLAQPTPPAAAAAKAGPAADVGLPTGTDLAEPLAAGTARLRLRNEMPTDAAVALTAVASGEVVRYLYVRSHESHMIPDIADGDYAVSFLSGQEWDPIDGRFRRGHAAGAMDGYVSVSARDQIQMVLLRDYPYAEVFDPRREAEARAAQGGPKPR